MRTLLSATVLMCLVPVLALAESPVDAPAAPARNAVWLIEPGTLRAASGVLGAGEGAILREQGGALLVSGRADRACAVELEVGEVRYTAHLEAHAQIAHVEVSGVETADAPPARGVPWRIVGNDCGTSPEAAIEGAVLFLGDAAAYVGENPVLYWSAMRRNRQEVGR